MPSPAVTSDTPLSTLLLRGDPHVRQRRRQPPCCAVLFHSPIETQRIRVRKVF
jgi:hypothetical protein